MTVAGDLKFVIEIPLDSLAIVTSRPDTLVLDLVLVQRSFLHSTLQQWIAMFSIVQPDLLTWFTQDLMGAFERKKLCVAPKTTLNSSAIVAEEGG